MSHEMRSLIANILSLDETLTRLKSENAQYKATNRLLRELRRPDKHRLRDLRRHNETMRSELSELAAITGLRSRAGRLRWAHDASHLVGRLAHLLNLTNDNTMDDIVNAVSTLIDERKKDE